MNESFITQYLTATFPGVEVVVAAGDHFFFDGPDHKMPFVTIVTSDAYDQFSNLNRPSVFRLNIGVGKETYQSMFGSQASASASEEVAGSGHDFTALDKIMPHPVYGRQHWVCVLNPSDATFQKLKPLIAEAYELSAGKHVKSSPKSSES